MRQLRLLALALLAAAWLAPPGQARAQQATVVAINQCAQALSLLVSVVSEGGERQTRGWFRLAAGSEQILYLANGDPVTHRTAMPFYIYATNADDSVTWSDQDLLIQWQGRGYAMQERDLLVVEGTGPFVLRAVRFAC